MKLKCYLSYPVPVHSCVKKYNVHLVVVLGKFMDLRR